MKKIISILLALAILFTCAYSAFALEVTTDPAIDDNGTYNYKPGDLDNDGVVTASDARSILRYAVNLYSWNDIAANCYNAYNYNYKLAADLDYDGFISASDARTALRVSVGLEKVEYEDLNTLTTTQQILDFYARAANAVKCGGHAYSYCYGHTGYTRTSWQYIKDEECSLLDVCNGRVIDHINSYLTSAGDAKGIVFAQGSYDAKVNFPVVSLNDYSKVKSAACTVNPQGNYVLTIVMMDADTTRADNGSFLYKMTDQCVTWAEDVEPILAESTQIKNWKGEKITTKNFTITAELTPNGKFLSLTHQADVVLSVEELTAYQLLIPITYKNKSAIVHTTTVYNNFEYPCCFRGVFCIPPAAYGTIDDIGDYVGQIINSIAYKGVAGYTVTKSQSIVKDGTNLSCITNNQASKYLKSSTLTTTKETTECWTNFPAFNLRVYDWIESATCNVNAAGNYVFIMTFHDVDTTLSSDCNVLQAVTNDLIYFDEDIAPIIRDMNSVKAYSSNGVVTYKDFTITVEVTPDGQLVYMKQEATVEAYTPYIKTLLLTHEDQQVTLKIEDVYTNFTY